MKKITVILWLILLHNLLMAQEDMRGQVSATLKKLAERYKQSSSVSYDMTYKYAAENKPDDILDSMSGSFKIHQSEYWYKIAETEAVGNGSIVMTLFKEDKVIYLTKPASSFQTYNPVAVLDSFVSGKKIMAAGLSSAGGIDKVVLTCRPGLSYKKIEYDIDSKTGFLNKMICWVQAKEFYDPSVKDKVAGTMYAVMEADFTNYHEGTNDEKDFDLGKYFKKEGSQYVTVPPYDSYKIFLGSPNL